MGKGKLLLLIKVTLMTISQLFKVTKSNCYHLTPLGQYNNFTIYWISILWGKKNNL